MANQTFGLEVIEVVTMKRIDIGRASVDSNLVTLKLFQQVWRTYCYGSAVLLFGWCTNIHSENASQCRKIMTLRNRAITGMNDAIDIDLHSNT